MLRIAIVFLFSLNIAQAGQKLEWVKEARDMQAKDYLLQKSFDKGLENFSQKELMDAAWDLITEDGVNLDLNQLSTKANFDLEEMIRTHAIEAWYGRPLPRFNEVVANLTLALNSGMLSRRAQYLLLNHKDDLEKHYGQAIYGILEEAGRFDLADYNKAKTTKNMSKEQARAMFWNAPDATTVYDGKYADGIRLFMFCRSDRNFPCMMVMKDKWGMPVEVNGKPWTQPAMAASSRGIPYNITNGNTPAGVHLINSVMPEANAQTSFGKFRRIILNFVAPSENESITKALLHESVHDLPFWRQANVARDVGRDLLRIHGTGRINGDPTSAHYPFRKTSGCISKREGAYPEATYIDQREMLDTMMKSLDLEVEYSNEVNIKGILTVAELDDTKAPVTSAEVLNLLFD
ncbi:MAG: hypothetical protein COW01_02585 [Bdellovibrionales bacterium CG12_big_fil_rev_8_21_14_0_65_38_15]|nr:MAG: hypothetical protein COW79_08250 [Bdellovibrionales bacterium CG22_combo_CG10-13_8_21_14_all_38_13]PIQ56980.1 MAG: hypothetical protein COW01_02585 [Bdellovibrionales bacterium CG12_big_fil_rev_8_21_14_0_65_38_15]PIR29059.1 MAG: hypothetical protein COV38_12535 [Bdellovibrionales bacterium CG11_big_fil_rev_8_21_14_0_20_38_13]